MGKNVQSGLERNDGAGGLVLLCSRLGIGVLRPARKRYVEADTAVSEAEAQETVIEHPPTEETPVGEPVPEPSAVALAAASGPVVECPAPKDVAESNISEPVPQKYFTAAESAAPAPARIAPETHATGRLHLAYSSTRSADVARLAAGIGGIASRIEEPDFPKADPSQESPAVAVVSSHQPLSIFSRKRIATIALSPQESVVVERQLQGQFGLVDGLRLSQVAADGGNLSHLDLLIVRTGDDAEAADPGLLNRLAMRGYPVLVTGPRRLLGGLVGLNRHGLFDFINEPWDPDELMWRAAGLLDRAHGRRRRGQSSDRLRVLVADDDAVTRALLAATLERCGMECTLVEHGSAAMEAIRQDPPHAVIMEVVMPGLDGFQVLAEMKRSPDLATLPVIMLSLRQSEPDILRGFGLGADDYITKPFSPMEVAARIKRLVDRAS